MPLDYTPSNVCLSDALTSDTDGNLRMQPYTVPRLVFDEVAPSGADGKMYATIIPPGVLLIDQPGSWINSTPLDHMVLIRVTRGPREWVTSNPNAIQFRDKWTWRINGDPDIPITTTLFNGQAGSAVDLGTNSTAEPNPGRMWAWWDVVSADELLGPVAPGQRLNVRYRSYVWTPPPWSDNANNSSPQHSAAANWARLQMIALPKVEIPGEGDW